jgi:uncharacterized protein YuzE
MKLHYSLYIDLQDEPGSETWEIAEGLNVDLNDKGQVVGIDIDQASRNLDLTTLEAVKLPLKATRIA